MYAASRMRSAFREHTEDPRVVFGFSIEAKDFGRKTRKEHPEVAEIINDNTTFLPEITDGPELAYRHPCLLQVSVSYANLSSILTQSRLHVKFYMEKPHFLLGRNHPWPVKSFLPNGASRA
jgi:hypothetical protein